MADFILSSILLGIALAMDAFSVSIANGLKEPGMRKGRMCRIAGCYALFQFIMPLCGYLIVHTIVEYFSFLQRAALWTGFVLLMFLGIKMIKEGIEERKAIARDGLVSVQEGAGEEFRGVGNAAILLQGIATSLDALSAGFAIAGYSVYEGISAALIIMGITFLLCLAGLRLGKKLGEIFAGRASVLGGVILMIIGIKLVI